MFLLAGIGEMAYKSSTERDTIVAAFMLYYFSYNVSSQSEHAETSLKVLMCFFSLSSSWVAPLSPTCLALRFPTPLYVRRHNPWELRGMSCGPS